MSRCPGLYLHLPFCSSICPYCDFSVLTGSRRARDTFVDDLLAEVRLARPEGWPQFTTPDSQDPFDTVYLGGGTPSLLTGDQLGRLTDELRRCLPLVAEPWMAMEVNPEDVTPRQLEDWKHLGVDFLSLGIQSFNDSELEFLGRRHSARQALQSIEQSLAAGIGIVSLDLIFGLPGQSSIAWRHSLELACGLGAQHISCYQLTMEPGTPFGFRRERGALCELDADSQADLFVLTHELLSDLGFNAYEVSNFARSPTYRSQHNRKYWRHVPYLGFGPSAHSFAGGMRWWNERKIRPWERRLRSGERPIAGHEILTTEQLQLERLMLGLRTADGVDFDDLPGDGGRLWRQNLETIEALAGRGWLTVEQRTLKPTRTGLAVADSLARSFTIEAATTERFC